MYDKKPTMYRSRIERGRNHGLRHRVEHDHRNLIVRKRVTIVTRIQRKWIIELVNHDTVNDTVRILNTLPVVTDAGSESAVAEGGKVTSTLGNREDVKKVLAGRMDKALPLIVTEEEQLIILDWTAEGST